MKINRRTLLGTGAAWTLAAGFPRLASAYGSFNPQPDAWRSFEIKTKIEVSIADGVKQAWVPVPSVNEADWFKSLGSTWTSNGRAVLGQDTKYGAQFVHVEWRADERAPVVEVVSKIATRDRVADLSKPGSAEPLSAAEHRLYTEGTELIPVDGIVKQTSDKITASAKTDIDKVGAIYSWIVENTYRDGNVRGCGIGDIASLLKSGNLGGKCADLNALYVGLVRAAGIPARDVYGIRIAPSRFGYKSLGANSQVITKAQHCRAETYLAGFGWVATDPADVRKVMLEEPPGHLPLDNPKVVDARITLLGGWEGNWLAYNVGHDIGLPGSQGPKLGFLMYPQVECAGSRLDCLAPETVKYEITARELPAT